jgi:hypothetical protein
MKISRWLLVPVLVALSASAAMADSIDPRFVPIGGGGSIILNSPTDPAFQISFTKNGTVGTVDCGLFGGPEGDLCIDPAATEFVNNTGQTWTSITLEITQQSAGLVFAALDNAIDPYFANAASGFLNNGNAFVTFFGIDATHPGILPATSCNFELGCTGPTANDGTLLYDFAILTDVGDMVDGQSFTVQGTATTTASEPPTILLALTGGLFLVLKKRR